MTPEVEKALAVLRSLEADLRGRADFIWEAEVNEEFCNAVRVLSQSKPCLPECAQHVTSYRSGREEWYMLHAEGCHNARPSEEKT